MADQGPAPAASDPAKPLGAPALDRIAARRVDLQRRSCPPVDQRGLKGLVPRLESPVARCDMAYAGRGLEERRQMMGSIGTERRTQPLVLALMAVDQIDDEAVERMCRL